MHANLTCYISEVEVSISICVSFQQWLCTGKSKWLTGGCGCVRVFVSGKAGRGVTLF